MPQRRKTTGSAGLAMSVHHLRELPKLRIKRLAVVGREYRGNKDEGFDRVFLDVIQYADRKACDAILFALYTTNWTWHQVEHELGQLRDLKHVRAVFVEHLDPQAPQRTVTRYCVYYRLGNEPWEAYTMKQAFGKLKKTKREVRETIEPFLAEARKLRNLGNCAVVLCGETNILNYSQKFGRVTDPHDYLGSISPGRDRFPKPRPRQNDAA